MRTGVNQDPSGGTLYPFVADSVLAEGILDLFLSYEDDLCAFSLPAHLVVSGTQISVLDYLDNVMCSVTVSAAKTTPWGNRTVYQWISETTVLQIVSTGFVNGTGELDTRTLERLPLRVKSLRFEGFVFTENIDIQAGFNILLEGVSTTRKDGGEFVDQITIDAVPGTGMGRQPGCTDVVPMVRQINGVQPDANGNFIIQADECFRNQLPVHATGSGVAYYTATSTIQLHSDCHPCNACSYYVRTYKGLKHVWNMWQNAAKTLSTTRDVYESNRNRWMAQKECREANVSNLVMISEGNCSTIIGGSFCNKTKCCISPVEVRFTAQLYKNGVLQPWPASAVISDSMINTSYTNGDIRVVPLVTGPILRFHVDYADPQQSVTAKFRVGLDCTANQTIKITQTVHASQPPPAPFTGEVCILPTPSVPAGIQSIWTALGVPSTAPARAVYSRSSPLDTTSGGGGSGGNGGGNGGGGGTVNLSTEVPLGPVNGINVTFSISATPAAGSLLVFKNGMLMLAGIDYTLSGNVIVFTSGNTPLTGDSLLTYYAS